MGPDRRTVWTALTWSAGILAFAEIWRCVLFPTSRQIASIGPVELAAGVWLMTLVPLVVHLGPLSLLLGYAGRRAPQLAVLGAAAFGLWWHVGVVQGDGIRSLDLYWPLRIMIATVAAGGLAAFVHFVLLPGRLHPRWRRFLVFAAVVIGARVSLYHFALYREFQGLLVVFLCVCIAWLLVPLASRAWMRWSALGFAVLSLAAAVAVIPQRQLVEGHLRRLTRITGPLLETLPGTRALMFPSRPLVDAAQAVTPEQATAFAEEATALAVGEHPPHGRNVLLIVLESVRADVWNDPQITPRFHAWRERGTYFPVAIAQYPATPLAYGSMFTGQYPSVLAQSPHWGEHRLFGEIEGAFDRMILTRPDVKWFDHNAVSSFFLPSDVPQHRHENAVEGLDFVREEIEAAGHDEQRFFAWAHLYEPHEPYQPREGYRFGDDARALYEGEVRWTDAALADFLDWFWAQPQAADTLVIVLGDHGEGLGEIVYGEPFTGHHVHVAGLVSHVPMFLAGPSVPEGRVRDDVRPAQIDLMPTVFEFLGRALPAHYAVQGRSVFAQLHEPHPRAVVTEAFAIRGNDFFDFVASAPEQDAATRRAAFRKLNATGGYAPKLGIEREGWRLVYDTMLDRTWLYDTHTDPDEEHDLSATEPERRDDMRVRLDRWRARQAWVLQQLEDL